MADPLARRRVLLVEDDASIRELVTLHLSLANFDVTGVGDGTRALNVARTTMFELIILDVMLPGLDGVTVCRAVRAEGADRNTPVLMLTARDAESDKVVGLESGADDYLTKPFGVRELMARVGALLRRGLPASPTQREPLPDIESCVAISCSIPQDARRSCAARSWTSRNRNSTCCICWRRAPELSSAAPR